MIRDIAAGMVGFISIPLAIAVITAVIYSIGWIANTLGGLDLPPHPYWAGFASFIAVAILSGVALSFFA